MSAQPKPFEVNSQGFCLPSFSSNFPELTLPKFPTIFELAEAGTPSTTNGPVGRLFPALLGSAHELYYELLEDPTRFEPAAATLIQELAAGLKSYSECSNLEKDLLDRATLEYNQPRRARSAEPSMPRSASTRTAVDHLSNPAEDEEVELEWHEGGRLEPITHGSPVPSAPASYWWR